MPRPRFTLLQVTPALDAGGVERTTVDVAAAVVRAGGRALVASRGGRLEGELAAAGGELVRLPMHLRDPVSLWRNAHPLTELAHEERVSLIHARSRAPAWSALLAARRAKTPFVTTYAGLHRSGSPWKRAYNSVMARGDLVIANSAFTRDHVLSEHPFAAGRVTTIPRGVDLAVFNPASVSPARTAAVRARFGLAEGDRPVFLLAGRLTRWKGQALMIEALARSGVDALLVLAGDDQGRTGYRAELEALAETRGLRGRVRIPGHEPDMAAAYLVCDFACAPSLEPEAFGRTAVEPQAMGRPVLAADHGATRETVQPGRGGWLLPPGDIEAWADGLREAAAISPAARRAMSEAGSMDAQAFSLEAMTEATLQAYARLLSAKRR